jgi:hypothetical protein
MASARNEARRSDVMHERWNKVKKMMAEALERLQEEGRVYLDQAGR